MFNKMNKELIYNQVVNFLYYFSPNLTLNQNRLEKNVNRDEGSGSGSDISNNSFPYFYSPIDNLHFRYKLNKIIENL